MESQIGTKSPTISDNISTIDPQSSDEKFGQEDKKISKLKLPDDQMLIYFPANSSRVLGKTTIKKLKKTLFLLDSKPNGFESFARGSLLQ